MLDTGPVHTTDGEAAIVRWHRAVNGRDHATARATVTDPIVVSGPRGAGPISVEEFLTWIDRSGVLLRPVVLHLLSERVIVVEQVATSSTDRASVGLATLFRITAGRVSAALRFPGVDAALDFAELYVALTATD